LHRAFTDVSASLRAARAAGASDRVAHLLACLADLHVLRSVVWFVGIGSAVAIFVAAA
jgi:uncharacterized MAPEG superfamily protein